MLTVRIQRTMGLERDSQGRPIQYFEIDVDTESELPDVIGGVAVGHGSVAYAISTAKLYKKGGDGNWHSTDDGSVPTLEAGES